ncbi:aspartate-semialdehyde dehydrogenase [Pseudomonas sp. B392_1p]|uniref:aspartate-semialdehyde dehydrogenase n=1 Tax=Pseudomonas sp. B392_1p TaxID=3457507 RepID=UPI003FD36FFB
MLPPILPSQVAVTSQQDPPKARPDVPPVVPVEETSADNSVALGKRDPEETAMRLREEQRRRQQQRERARAEGEASGEALEEEYSLDENLPRKGIWVDIKA